MFKRPSHYEGAPTPPQVWKPRGRIGFPISWEKLFL